MPSTTQSLSRRKPKDNDKSINTSSSSSLLPLREKSSSLSISKDHPVVLSNRQKFVSLIFLLVLSTLFLSLLFNQHDTTINDGEVGDGVDGDDHVEAMALSSSKTSTTIDQYPQTTTTIIINNNNNDNNNRNIQILHSTIPHLILSSLPPTPPAEPLLLSGWHPLPSSSHPDHLLLSPHPSIPQYLKGIDVQPYRNSRNEACITTTSHLLSLMNDTSRQHPLLFFTNDYENPDFFSTFPSSLATSSPLPSVSSNAFKVFSRLSSHTGHPFHKHDASWIGSLAGVKAWWFLPPSTPRPAKVNPCLYLSTLPPPPGASFAMQRPGDVVTFGKDWWHATCALEDGTMGIGRQKGDPKRYRQGFGVLNATKTTTTRELSDCRPSKGAERQISKETTSEVKDDRWTYYDGDLNEYYNKLVAEDSQRDPKRPETLAVHRWLGDERSTLVHYDEIKSAVRASFPSTDERLRVLDAGCGLGAGLVWFEREEPGWELMGRTISTRQFEYVEKELPKHRFEVELRSYDDLGEVGDPRYTFDVIYSIEALIHSTNLVRTLTEWSQHLKSTSGLIIIIDDFLVSPQDRDTTDVKAFISSWLGNTLSTPDEMTTVAQRLGLTLVDDVDLGKKYKVNRLNYRNKKPDIKPDHRTHQGWLGSKYRQLLMLEGRLTYRMLVFGNKKLTDPQQPKCTAVPTKNNNNADVTTTIVKPDHMSGIGSNGGHKIKCISGWYCCNKGRTLWDELERTRTDHTNYLKLPRDLFGHYMDVFAKHLNDFYATMGDNPDGKFLDIGGTGSVKAGMRQVTTKFQHFTGPLSYWILDSDPSASTLSNALHCPIEDCPSALNCTYDVTFSHTVLEHSSRPWDAFDTISRVTKKGGLTLHLVPWSYQYHATPEDHFRFGHGALRSLLEDRGFEVLEVGYDVCEKAEDKKGRRDEHYDVIWLSYVVGRKL